MKITRDNYEIYMIDFFDNNLSKEQAAEMKRFLDANPDIKEEAEGIMHTSVEEEPVRFPEKNKLKAIARNDDFDISRTDYLCVADLEGDISEEEKTELTNLTEQNENLLDDLALYGKTRLQVNENILFSQKEQLKDICKEAPEELKRIDYLAIALAEGDISEAEAEELEALMEEQPELKDELGVYEKTQLKADKSIVYDDKSALKQRLTMAHYKFTYTPVAVAASIVAVFFILGNLLTPQEVLNVGSMANLDFSDKVRTYEYHEAEPEELPVANTYVSNTQYASNIQNTAADDTDNHTGEQDKFDDDYRPAEILKANTNIPRADAHVFAQNERVEIPIPEGMPSNYYDDFQSEKRSPKNQAWMIAEKGVDIWKTMTSSEVMMANSYNDKGEIERLNIQGSRLEISRTFYDK